MYKLLIVDDEPFIADGLARHIDWQSVGFKVAGVAYDAEKALELLKAKEVDVLLTDIILGKRTGFWLIEEAIKVNDHLHCVVLSGHEEFSYAKTAIRLGVYDYLVKPVDLDELEELLKKLYQKMSGNAEDINEKESQENQEGIIINQVKGYIDTHYGEEIHLNTLAEQVFVHPTYLSILFKKKTGSNYKDYLTQVRIEKAKELLKDVSLRIMDISNHVGYESPKHFSKVFKEVTGMTPKDYRNSI